jgi:S-adenosylmethionine:tRNA ribosyltransferase-isomerase
MHISDFDYSLPEELIAQNPVVPRDSSRLLVLNRFSGDIIHRKFIDIVSMINAGDLLVLNDTRVIPARIFGYKADTGGKAELLLLKTNGNDVWEALVKPGKRLKEGSIINIGNGELVCEILQYLPDGGRIIKFSTGVNAVNKSVNDLIHEFGELPLPPYIYNGPAPDKRDVYQTVYARFEGSSAAPTAGLHFTDEIFRQLKDKGVNIAFVTLHVGLGTFRPIQTENVMDHIIHEEWYEMSADTADIINKTKKNGNRVICVGTTSVRTVESSSDEFGEVHHSTGSTSIFITPGYKFKSVDALITNFHMPKSTLLLLISALAGRDNIMKAYNAAIQERYRFLSFGDAMFIY